MDNERIEEIRQSMEDKKIKMPNRDTIDPDNKKRLAMKEAALRRKIEELGGAEKILWDIIDEKKRVEYGECRKWEFDGEKIKARDKFSSATKGEQKEMIGENIRHRLKEAEVKATEEEISDYIEKLLEYEFSYDKPHKKEMSRNPLFPVYGHVSPTTPKGRKLKRLLKTEEQKEQTRTEFWGRLKQFLDQLNMDIPLTEKNNKEIIDEMKHLIEDYD